MTGEDIFRALSEIDDELLVRPSRTALKMRKGRKRKKFALILVAVMATLALCAFGYASRLDMTYEDGVVEISVYNPNAVDEYEQWSMGYIADGYEVIQISATTWEVTNGSSGFYISQMPLSERASAQSKPEIDGSLSETQLLKSLSELTVDTLAQMRTVCWMSQECMYFVLVWGQAEEEIELVAMIQSITP